MATTRVRIGPADHGRRMTLDEFLDAEEVAGYRYELARGILEVTHVPNRRHGQVVSNLYRAFFIYSLARADVLVRIGGGSEFRFFIPEMESGRNPDVAVVVRGTPIDSRGDQPPSLAAEVVSKGGEERDYVVKSEEYLALGLQEYWIVDPFKRQVTVKVREVDGDAARWRDRVSRGAERIPSEMLPGFEATVDSLWKDVDPESE